MNRCRPKTKLPPLAAILAAAVLMLAATHGAAQTQPPQRIPPISAKALRGTLHITQPPDVLLNGKPARLAPGARIRGRNNLIVVSAMLVGQDLPVRYTVDMLGLLQDVWVLTDAEIASDPMPSSLNFSNN